MSAASRSVALAIGVLSSVAAVAAPESATSGASSVVHIAPYKAMASVTGSLVSADGDLMSTGVSTAQQPSTAIVAEKSIDAFALVGGQPIQTQLQSWAARAGWTVVWDVQQDWIVPNAATFTGDFASAAQQVIEALAANGADVRADLYTGNRSMVVHQAGNE
ncbi:toxin co-regulated pilus biosynthesis Q family protein [Burkholderia cenocepacia]|uniref:toxin co-regulated pilus biosynthesis Q family protein n=1 Tax=Burkholderia cenocepacia TaxID=95486 RepID=UPI002AB69ED4|nr:toxin co-regulated pilus biosynthesis Q family protein [Burkholderia cenocepacia]